MLPDDQKLTIEIARVIRVGFLQQNAFHAFDELVQMKYTVPYDVFTKLDELQKAIDTKLAAVAQG